MRKTIARRLVEAKREIPHIYLTADATVDALYEMREQINELGDGKDQASTTWWSRRWRWRSPRARGQRVVDGRRASCATARVDVGVAVSLPDEGSITPVVRDADQKSLGAIAAETARSPSGRAPRSSSPRSSRAARRRCRTSACSASREFVAIINPPESVILAVGATEKRAVVVEKRAADATRSRLRGA